MLTVILVSLLWSIGCSVWVQPIYVGVSVSALVEVILVIGALHLVSVSPMQLKVAEPYIDEHIRKKAFLEAKNAYINGRNAVSMN
jgi:ABC-type uncharacterized transport system permease subunit